MDSRERQGAEVGSAVEARGMDVTRASVSLSDVLEAMPHAVLVVDHAGTLLYANGRSESLLGYRRAELVGMVIEKLVPADVRRMHASTRRTYLEEDPRMKRLDVGRELRALRKDGVEVPIEISLSPSLIAGRRVVLCAVHDVSRRKQAELARRDSEKQLRLLEAAIRDTDDAVLITSAATEVQGGRILFINRALSRMTGYEPHELLGQLASVLGPDPEGMDFERMRRTTSDGRPFRAKSKHQRKDGTSFWAQWSIAPICDRSSDRVQFVIVGRDVTVEHDRAREIEESHRFLQATIDALSAHVVVVAPDGTILAVNAAWRAFARAAGAPEHAFLGANYFDVGKRCAGENPAEPSRAVFDAVREIIAGERSDYYIEYPCDSPTEARSFGMRVTAFSEPPPRRVVIAHTDVTERRRIEKILDQRLAWRRLIAELSTRFIDLPAGCSDASITEALGAIGEFLGADRVYVFQLGSDGQVIRNMHAYQSSDVRPDPGLSPNAWTSADEGRPLADEGWRRRVALVMRHLHRQSVFHIPVVNALPEGSEARALLEEGGIRSILCVPMVHRQRVLGFVGVDAIAGERRWIEEDRLSLQTVAEILANAYSRWRTESLFRSVVHGISGVTGVAFLASLVEELCRGLEADYAFVGELSGGDAVRTLAVHGSGQPLENFTYLLDGSPCADVIGSQPCIHRKDVARLYPRDTMLEELGIQAYAGMPLLDAAGNTMGLLAVMYRRSIVDAELVLDMLRVFAARAAAEVERRHKDEELRALNTALERRVAERTSEVMLQATAMDATTEGMAILENSVYVYVNDAHARMYGYESGRELIGEHWHMLHGPEENARIEREIFPELQKARRYRGETRGRRRDGDEFDVSVALTLTEQGHLICCCEDITERKRMQDTLSRHRDALRQANSDLARAARLKDEFLASTSHELRTPLNAVLGMAEVLQEEMVGSLNNRQMSCVRIIEESGRHLLSLINDILDLSKIEAGKLELSIGHVDVRVVCEASLRLIRSAAQAKQHRILFVCDPALARVRADERRLKQMLMNLLGNAVKFTPEGGEVGLEARADVRAGQAQFIVWDNGIGIAPEDRAALFQPFSQVDHGLTKQHAGTGLGLSLVRRLAELHGGSVSVESELGRGSRFTIVLPWETTLLPTRCTPIPPSSTADGACMVEGPSSKDGPSVLLVDDNEPSLRMLQDYFSLKGYRVLSARNGAEAVDIVAAEPVEAVLMDIQMPGMDGLAAIRAIRQDLQRSALPIIAMTALAMSGDRERCISAGANEYVTKPVSPRHLMVMLDGMLSTWPMR